MLQVFDSWAGILPKAQYSEFAIPYIRQICDAIQEVPITVFAKDAWFALEELGQLDCNTIGLDWHLDPQDVRQKVGSAKALQGNLDPCLLYAPEAEIAAKTQTMIERFQKQHIVNLGHGVYPDTPLDGVKCFVNTVKAYRY